MKNWLPLVSGPEFAIASVPFGYRSVGTAGSPLGLGAALALGSGSGSADVGRYSSGNRYAGPPLPVPFGSQHCSTKMPLVVSRWHLVLLKNCLLARSVISGLVAGSIGVQAHSAAAAGGFFFDENPPAAQTMPTTTSTTARAAPIPACTCRRRRAAAARRAIWRSTLARAMARCRFLL